jgi:transcriptional regulator with XRE-family HTH domain
VILLEQLRMDALLTPEQLAEKIEQHPTITGEVSGRTIRRIEEGGRARLSSLAPLAEFFEVRPTELLRDVRGEVAA